MVRTPLPHAASVFYGSDLEEAAILTVDGVGEWATTGLWKGVRWHRAHLSGELSRSIGLVYSAFTAFLGFRVNNGEYKVMGMAAYGDPVYEEQVNKVLWTNDWLVRGQHGVPELSLLRDRFVHQEVRDAVCEPRFGSAFDPTSPEGNGRRTSRQASRR